MHREPLHEAGRDTITHYITRGPSPPAARLPHAQHTFPGMDYSSGTGIAQTNNYIKQTPDRSGSRNKNAPYIQQVYKKGIDGWGPAGNAEKQDGKGEEAAWRRTGLEERRDKRRTGRDEGTDRTIKQQSGPRDNFGDFIVAGRASPPALGHPSPDSRHPPTLTPSPACLVHVGAPPLPLTAAAQMVAL
ncbi:hypothetical protein DPEC_G00346690 [Dallia pectoralis]|uniref:Uncharacterized protein n=1 Tax=Dallia pectoralis TaxID=75939 RepID=A0ACC2F4A3_DALPE|nr:hypothetical protein DPEC_G00346690 [Dallia pectoralis]